MKLLRRRDHALVDAEILRPGEDTSLPVLLIGGEPFAAGETPGYLLVEASAAEAAELYRGRYALLQLIERTS